MYVKGGRDIFLILPRRLGRDLSYPSYLSYSS